MGFVNRVLKKLKTDKQYAKMFYIAAAAFVLAVIVIIACVFGLTGDTEDESTQDETQQETVTDGEETKEAKEQTTQEQAQPVVDYTVPDVLLEENAYANVNDLIAQYFNAMTNGDTTTISSLRDTVEQEELIKIEKESAYIDEFDGIKVYTKPGPMTGSFVAFVYYEIKFTAIETLAPGLTTLYLCPREDGSLYICDGNMTQQDTDYIKAIVAQTDVADLFAKVETKYAEAIDADANLNEFMGNLSAKLDAEVSQAMAQLNSDSEEETQEAAEQAQPEQEEAPQAQAVEELVKTTDTVNVRASDSENADRIGRIAVGETITRYEKKENGWSRVDYNGTEGYIKSEYLETVESANAAEPESEPQEEPEEQEEQQEDAPATNLTAKGKVTIKETVNVRKSASTTADKLGVAYQGETYDLIMEQADGWCKIKFNGETGYVKTEFVE